MSGTTALFRWLSACSVGSIQRVCRCSQPDRTGTRADEVSQQCAYATGCREASPIDFGSFPRYDLFLIFTQGIVDLYFVRLHRACGVSSFPTFRLIDSLVDVSPSIPPLSSSSLGAVYMRVDLAPRLSIHSHSIPNTIALILDATFNLFHRVSRLLSFVNQTLQLPLHHATPLRWAGTAPHPRVATPSRRPSPARDWLFYPRPVFYNHEDLIDRP